MKHDLLITALNGVGIVLGMFLLNGYIARAHGLDVLGEYLLVRRTSSALAGVLLLGMNVGLANYIAKDNNGNFGHGALLTFIVYTVPFLLILLIPVALDVFPGFNPLYTWAYFVFVLGVCLQSLTYSLFRGHMNMIGANLLQITSTTLVPLVVAVFVTEVGRLLSTIGISVIILSLAGYLFKNGGFQLGRVKWVELRQLWRYGGERVLGFASQFVLLAGVPILVVPYVSFAQLSFLSASIGLVRVFLIFVGPLGIVLLPRVSRMLSKGFHEEVSRNLELLVASALFFGTLGAASLSLFGPEILAFWLGNVSEEGGWAASVLLLTVPFFVTVGVLRSPIDAASPRGHNSIIFLVSASALLTCFFGLKLLGVPAFKAGVVSFLVGYGTSFCLSLMTIKKLLQVQPFSLRLFRDLVAALLLLSVVYLLVTGFVSSKAAQMSIFFFFVVMGVSIFSLASPEPWLRALRQKVLR